MQIHKTLKPYATPINELHTWDKNPRRGNIEAIKTSLKRFGQRQPIIYKTETINNQTFKTVYAGNHRLQAATELGWKQIAAVEANDLTHEEIQAYAIADNRTTDLSEYDKDALAEIIAEINQTDQQLLEDLQYEDDEIEQLIDGMPYEDSPGNLNDSTEESEIIENLESNNECPKCGFEWQNPDNSIVAAI